MADPALEPLRPEDARKLARAIVEKGTIAFSGHALEEVRKDDLSTVDCENLIRAGVFQGAEYINNQWRYRVETARICVVVTFLSTARMRVVTAWRFK